MKKPNAVRMAGVFALALLSVGRQSVAQQALASRMAPILDKERVSLPAMVSPRLAVATRLGEVQAETVLPLMTLRFNQTALQQAALQQLLLDQQNPASPQYHRWLTPEQFASRFGLSTADIAKARAWLTEKGFTVRAAARGGQYLRFSGTVAQVENAFQTHVERVSIHGNQSFAVTVSPTMPKSLAAVTTAISGINTFTLHSRFTSSAGTHYLAPGDLYTQYGSAGLTGAGVDGTGVTIAVVGQAEVDLDDIASFRSASGLVTNPPTVSLYGADPGSQSSVDVRESTLNLEWAGAAAPKASILFVTTSDVLNGSITEVIDQNLAPILSDSYGACEADLGAAELAYYNQLLQQAAAEGMTVIAPAGDAGATDCDVTEATSGLAVDFPASSPYVTAVGGTELQESAGTYWSTSNGAYGGSAAGCSGDCLEREHGKRSSCRWRRRQFLLLKTLLAAGNERSS